MEVAGSTPARGMVGMVLVSIIGAGRVGSTTAFVLAMKGLSDIRLVDIMERVPQGEALDIMHGAASGFSVDVSGSNDFKDIAGSDIVINTAGMARRPGMDRLDLLNRNIQILNSVAGNIKSYAPVSIAIQVSNPMDVMTYVMKKATGFPRERVMGMGGMLDSQRFSLFLAEELGAKPVEVKSMVIGEHGESQAPLFSQSSLKGECVMDLLDDRQRQRVLKRTRDAGNEVIGLKGATFFAPALAIARMVENILRDRKEIIPCSVYLEGEYEHEGLCIGVPARLGKNGMEGVTEPDITDEEKEMFDGSAKKMKGVIEELKL